MIGGLRWIGETILTPIFRGLMKFTFQIAYLRTDGPFPFGRPVTPGIGANHTGFSEGLLPFFAARAYDMVWLGDVTNGGGRMTIFALLLFVVLTAIGGYFQFFKWYPTESFDPIIGIPLIIFWFPISYGVLAIAHRFTLAIPLDLTAVTGFLTLVTANAWALPYGVPLVKIGLLIYIIIAFVMWVRLFAILVYLVFGPVMLAIIFANIPGLSEAMKDLMKLSLPIALIPVPFTLVVWVFQLFFIGGGGSIISAVFGIPGVIWYGAGISATALFGSFIFIIMAVTSLYSIWWVFKMRNAMFQTADNALRKTAGAAGIYATTGDAGKAAKALRQGPTRVGAKSALEDDDK